jgi:hypothetical protein
MSLEDTFPDAPLFLVHIVDDYFAEIIQYLSTGTALQEYTTMQKKKLVLHATDYQLITGHLYKMGANNIMRRYVLENERPRILAESHEGITGGNYVGKDTVQKVLRARLERILLEMRCLSKGRKTQHKGQDATTTTSNIIGI